MQVKKLVEQKCSKIQTVELKLGVKGYWDTWRLLKKWI